MPPAPLIPLDDERIEAAKPAAKPTRLYDGGGLFLLIQPSGARYWRFKYRFGGRAKSLSAGVYPEVSIEQARACRTEFRALLAQGIDPSAHRAAERARQREAQETPEHQARFTIESDGALSIRLSNRRVNLTPTEAAELRRFLDATRTVAPR
ncbi:MAG: Arm DNA-binding domain-containing protein [Novosphingobium sp.]